MHSVIAKTFGGLTLQYYIRSFLFGLIFPVLIFFMATARDTPATGSSVSIGEYFFFSVTTLLYPYSRFVYESVIDYITGDNVFIVNAFAMLTVKFFTMLLCWLLAIFIAPVGLLYLFIRHSRDEAKTKP